MSKKIIEDTNDLLSVITVVGLFIGLLIFLGICIYAVKTDNDRINSCLSSGYAGYDSDIQACVNVKE